MDITTVSRLDMTAFRHMIAEILTLPESLVFDANNMQDVSKLDKFITISNADQSDIGIDVRFNGTDEEEITSILSEVTISVNAYGKDAYDILCKLTASMHLTIVWQHLKRLGMGYLKCSQIRSLPTTIDGGQEQHEQVDITFSINTIIKTHVNRGETVKFNIKRG